jgi:adhesin/invasin
VIPSPSISILDQYNNPVGNYTVRAVLNGATLTSNSTRNVATGTDGNATFSNLITNTAGTGYTLRFSFNATTPTTASNSTTSANFMVSPDAAYGLVMVSQPPTTAQAGVPFDDGNAPQVRLKDRFNNNVPQANMTITAMANAVSGGPGNAIVPADAALTDESGTATFYGLGINGTVGVYTLTFSNSTLTTNTTSNNVTLTPGVATKLFVATQPPATVQANATLTPAVVNLQDAFSNNLTSSNASVTAALQGAGATLNGTATSNTTTGAATFNDLRIEGFVGNYTLLFESAGLSNATSSNIEVTADQSTAAITISANATDSAAGAAIQGPPAGTIEDQYGNALAGYTVNATINKNTGNFTGTTSETTDASGVATFDDLEQTVAATDYTLMLAFNNGLTSGNATTANFTVNPAAANKLAVSVQPSANAEAGIAIPQQPSVLVQDEFGNLIATDSSTVVTASTTGTDIVGGSTNATASSGNASFSGLSLNGTAGNYTIEFSATGLTSATSNTVELGSGEATKLVVSTQPATSVAAGDALDPQPAVRLQDEWDNNVDDSGVTVTASVTPGSASTGGNITANTTAGGVATFDGLTLAGTIGNYTLSFNATGLTSATSDSVEITANPATAVISISTNATTSVAGQTIAGPPAATVVDGSGNALSGITVNATINKNSGNFTGTTSVSSNATGVASFGNLTQTVAAADYNLTLAFNNGLTSGTATTANFSVTAAAAANMTVVHQPANAIAGAVIASNSTAGTFPTVRLRDTFGNDVASQNVTVTLQTGTLNGTLNVATNASGNATFSDLVCNTAGFYRLSFASGGLSALSNQFDIFAGSATSLVFMNTLQTTAQAGIALDPQPVVQVRDAFGNNVAGTRPISVAASTGSLNGNTTVATNANGTASFSGLALTGTIGSRTLTFSSSGLTSLTSNSITLTAGPAASLVVDVQPASAFIAGDELTGSGGGFPTVTVKDAYNNAVSTTINATGVGFTMFGDGSVTSLPTDGNGTAVFADLMVEQAGNDLRVNFAAGGVSANTDPFNVNPGVPYSMTVTTQPPATVASGVILSPNPAVALKDVFQNTVTSPYEVQVSLGSGNGTLSGTANVTTSSGVATFTDLSIAQLGNYTLSFRTLGYDPELSVPSSQFSVVSPVASGLAITGISAVGGNYQIAFTAQQGGNYWIQKSTDLMLPWTYVSNTASSATTGANTVNVTAEPGNKTFWRLTTQAPGDN